MTKFERPHQKKWDYPEIGLEAATSALRDAGISYSSVQAVGASYCYGDSTCGQKAVYGLGLTGVPIFNVNNNCSSGSTALLMARNLIQAGYDCTLAVGFEKMDSGLTESFTDRASSIYTHTQSLKDKGVEPGPLNSYVNAVTSDVVKMFAYAARDHCKEYGTKPEHFAKIASKNRRHGAQNPRAAIQKATSPEEVLSKRLLCEPITMAMSAPTGDGGAAAVLCSEEFLEKHNLQNKAVEIVGQSMCTDLPDSFTGRSFLGLCGYTMSKRAAHLCLQQAGLTIKDVDIIELHDCFSPNELFLYEALGLCPEGKGSSLVEGYEWTTNRNGGELCRVGQRWVVNPSGGLESKGGPLSLSLQLSL